MKVIAFQSLPKILIFNTNFNPQKKNGRGQRSKTDARVQGVPPVSDPRTSAHRAELGFALRWLTGEDSGEGRQGKGAGGSGVR